MVPELTKHARPPAMSGMPNRTENKQSHGRPYLKCTRACSKPPLMRSSLATTLGRILALTSGLCAIFPALVASVASGYVGVQAVGLTRWEDDDIKKLAEVLRVQSRGVDVEVAVLPFTYEPDVLKVKRKLNTVVKHSFAGKDSQGKTTKFLGNSFRLTLHLWFDHGTAVPPVPQREPYKEYYWEPNTRPKANPMQSRFRWSVFNKVVGSSEANLIVVPDDQARLNSDERHFLGELRRRAQAIQEWRTNISAWLGPNRMEKFRLAICPELEDTHDFDSTGLYEKCLFWLSQFFVDDGSVSVEFRRSVALGDLRRPTFGGSALSMEFHGRFSDVNSSLMDGDVFSNDGCLVNILAATIPGIVSDESSKGCGTNDSVETSADFIAAATNHVNPSHDAHLSFLIWRAAYNFNPGDATEVFRSGQPQKKFYPRSRKKLIPFTNHDRLVNAAGADDSGDVESAFLRKILNAAKPRR
jgi:hypothetical protein